MTAQKRKSVEQSKKQPKRAIMPKQKGTPSVGAAVLERRQTWQAEVDNLMGREFATIEAATRTLVDAVFAKIGSSSEVETEEREFVYNLLATDAEFQEDLGRILKIKRS